MTTYTVIFSDGTELYAMSAETEQQAMDFAEAQMARNYGELMHAVRAIAH